MHDVEAAGEIRIGAAAMGQHELELRESGRARRTSAASRRRAWCRRCIARSARDRISPPAAPVRPEPDGSSPAWPSASRLAPERIERKLAEIGVLDIGRDDHAAGADPGGALELFGGGLRVDQRNRAIQANRSELSAHHSRQRIVQHPMPGDAGVGAGGRSRKCPARCRRSAGRCPAGRARRAARATGSISRGKNGRTLNP